MLGMFCKLAERHVTTYVKGASEDGHQKLEKSGIITELMRMRDFCFVLRDRAKTALDVAMMRIEDSNGAIQNTFIHEHRKRHDTTLFRPPPLNSDINTDTQSSKHNGEPQATFVQAFETTFAKPMATTNQIPQQPPILRATDAPPPDLFPSLPTPEAEFVQSPSSHGFNNHNLEKTYSTSSENIMNHISLESHDVSMQEESGLWNWWDLIEMDFDGNKQML